MPRMVTKPVEKEDEFLLKMLNNSICDVADEIKKLREATDRLQKAIDSKN